jgi:UDPglucose--hexose-1-phosphate uridylyltransferase
MPQLRKDPLSDRWVIYAEGREQRPNEFERVERRRQDVRCPFCAGHEEDTPPHIATYRGIGTADSNNGDSWSVRVVPNKYPALLARGCTDPMQRGIYVGCDAVGAHEVIVDTPRHVASLAELTPEEAQLLMLAYCDRIRAIQNMPGVKYALVFKNVGPEAGASLEHAHSQVIATPMVPSDVQRELAACRRLFREHKQCFFCRVIKDELAHRLRLAAESERFVAVCPYASRMPYELWVLPREHHSHFERQTPDRLAELAGFLQRIISQLESRHEHVAYNYFLHTAPFDTSPLRHYHWHIEVFPRLTTTAGFEWGAGYYINPVPPEQAAAILRSSGENRG